MNQEKPERQKGMHSPDTFPTILTFLGMMWAFGSGHWIFGLVLLVVLIGLGHLARS
jgi:hypothetical protein